MFSIAQETFAADRGHLCSLPGENASQWLRKHDCRLHYALYADALGLLIEIVDESENHGVYCLYGWSHVSPRSSSQLVNLRSANITVAPVPPVLYAWSMPSSSGGTMLRARWMRRFKLRFACTFSRRATCFSQHGTSNGRRAAEATAGIVCGNLPSLPAFINHVREKLHGSKARETTVTGQLA